jgi:hypothetical protein
VAVGVPGMYLAGHGLEYSGAAVVYRQSTIDTFSHHTDDLYPMCFAVLT